LTTRMHHSDLTRQLSLAIPIVFSLFFLRCSNENVGSPGLYNIDSVITRQIFYLKNNGAEIRKKAVLNGQEKITIVSPKDSLDWSEELGVFLDLDVINKPIYKEQYKVEDLADKESNLRVKSYTTTEDLPVKFLRVYYYRSTGQVRKIEAQYDEANSLYTSSRFLTLEFENASDITLLTSYSVDGGQKMFLDDSVEYTIDAGIVKKK
jgi:hypothetical protein